MKRGTWIGLSLLLVALFIGGGVTVKQFRNVPAVGSDNRPGIIAEVRTDDPVIALTFDVGWEQSTSEEILDLLRKYEVRATFFMPGSLTEDHTRFLHRLAGEGHETASHGYEHLRLTCCSQAQVADQIRHATAKFRAETGSTPHLFRTPEGDYNTAVIAEAAKQGQTVILWSIDALDSRNPDAAAIASRVITRAHPGAIVRFRGEEPSRQTIEALPAVIDGLRALGYRLVPVGELLHPPRKDSPKTSAPS
jgi:peptidoglycan/xylan/chitin deacetylase (PgdA/CDA1 family)